MDRGWMYVTLLIQGGDGTDSGGTISPHPFLPRFWMVQASGGSHQIFGASVGGQSLSFFLVGILTISLPRSYNSNTILSEPSSWVSQLQRSNYPCQSLMTIASSILTTLKSRSRIANDPQNTTWANNTTRFGHKILTSQGWTPGSSLGATDAAHAAHYTAASASHIRVLLKDDNLGLGAKRGSETAENFGLAGLASILGRLNGNEEAVKKEEERQEKIQQRAYVYRKLGMMNFVSGGFLVGGEMKGKNEIAVKKEVEVKEEVIKSESESGEEDAKKSKKRKRSRDVKEEEDDEGISADQPKLKRKKKSMNLREEAGDDDDDAQDSSSKSKKSKKDKKEKRDKKDKKDKKKSSTKSSSITDTPTFFFF